MTDLKKRSTLKTLSAASAIAAVPAIATATTASTVFSQSMSNPSNRLSLAFSRSDSSSVQTVTLSNGSSSAATLKHVSPGLVKSGDDVFDVNDLLIDEPITLKSGESRSYALAPAASGTKERRAPGGTISNQAVSVSTHYSTLAGSGTVTTQRLCLA